MFERILKADSLTSNRLTQTKPSQTSFTQKVIFLHYVLQKLIKSLLHEVKTFHSGNFNSFQIAHKDPIWLSHCWPTHDYKLQTRQNLLFLRFHASIGEGWFLKFMVNSLLDLNCFCLVLSSDYSESVLVSFIFLAVFNIYFFSEPSDSIEIIESS